MGTSKNSFLLRTAAISAGGVVRPNYVLDIAIGYACGDFDLPPKPEKISHVLVTKAIFRGSLIFYFELLWPTVQTAAVKIAENQ
jgi:hypothetical protein